ncbi:TPA: acyl--CoA ligase [Vibrio parahaemolyticus]|nr:acyl--CoA ligase [Vibrio parahaemolyticus]
MSSPSSVFQILSQHENSNKVAIVEGESELSYSELVVKSKEIAEHFKVLTGNQHLFALVLENSIDFILAYFATSFSKNINVPINPKQTDYELREALSQCNIDVIITTRMIYESFASSIDHKGMVTFFIDEMQWQKDRDDLVLNPSRVREELDDVAVLLPTSGTTSTPKRVMLTHSALIRNIKINNAYLNLCPTDRTLVVLPMFFGYAHTAQFLAHIYIGATIVLYNGISDGRFILNSIAKYRITNTTLVPPILHSLATQKKISLLASSLRFICYGGGFTSEHIVKRIVEHLPQLALLNTYGMTEASPRLTGMDRPSILSKIGSVGRPLEGIKIRVVDKNNVELDTGSQGYVQALTPCLMKGYYNDLTETQNMLQGRWLVTGDIGYLDQEGYLFLTGRIKNVIICGGTNISAEEIEAVICAHDAVLDCVVFGVSDEFLGEIPLAKLVLNGKHGLDVIEDIRNWCNSHLSSFKVPKDFIIVDELEKTATGKTRRVSNVKEC